jgi:hypothetical protein
LEKQKWRMIEAAARRELAKTTPLTAQERVILFCTATGVSHAAVGITEHAIYAPLGLYLQQQAWRTNVAGVAQGPLPFFWGVSKTA